MPLQDDCFWATHPPSVPAWHTGWHIRRRRAEETFLSFLPFRRPCYVWSADGAGVTLGKGFLFLASLLGVKNHFLLKAHLPTRFLFISSDMSTTFPVLYLGQVSPNSLTLARTRTKGLCFSPTLAARSQAICLGR